MGRDWEGGENQKAKVGQEGNKGSKLVPCFHSWDIQNNEPFSAEDEWAAVEIMSEVLLQINKSVSPIPIWREF